MKFKRQSLNRMCLSPDKGISFQIGVFHGILTFLLFHSSIVIIYSFRSELGKLLKTASLSLSPNTSVGHYLRVFFKTKNYPKLCGKIINCPIARVSIPCKAVQSFLRSLFKVFWGRSEESHVTIVGLAKVGRVRRITENKNYFSI